MIYIFKKMIKNESMSFVMEKNKKIIRGNLCEVRRDPCVHLLDSTAQSCLNSTCLIISICPTFG